MLENQIFYHAITRKIIVAFGSLFSDVKIQRKASDTTATFTGSISGTTLTISNVASGTVTVGSELSGTGIAEDTKIIGVISEAAKTYTVSPSQTLTSRTIIATAAQTLAVPISYAPKEKWLLRIDQDPNLDNYTYISLPRMSFEITGMSYDPSRKTNRSSLITCGAPGSIKKTFAPVPYNIDISLYIISKTQEDCLQIVEQILPYFNPEFTLSVKAVQDLNMTIDIPVVLNAVNIQDDYDGDFQTRRFVTYTLNFTMKSMFFGPASEGKIITNVLVDTINMDTLKIFAGLEVEGDEATGQITQETWNER